MKTITIRYFDVEYKPGLTCTESLVSRVLGKLSSAAGNNKTIWPINLQIKEGAVHKMRPAKWYGKATSFSIFENVEDFLAAMEETMYKNKDTRDDAPDWLQKVLDSYEKHYGVRLQIPRWSEIASKYVNR